jgi:glycosyltransferase involved in cell wall biosynthesis
MHSTGQFIAFLDDDDEWLSTKLEEQVPLLENSSSKLGMVYCWMDYCDEKGCLIEEHHPTHRGNVFPLVLDRQRIGGCPTLLVRRSVVEEVGGFDIELPRGNDGDFIRRVCREYEVDFVPKVLVKVYIGHRYDRITRSDEQGIRNAIKGQEAKLTKFEGELDRYPKQTASILAAIAYHHTELGDWRSALNHYWRAVTTHSLSAGVYVSLLRALRGQIARWGV